MKGPQEYSCSLLSSFQPYVSFPFSMFSRLIYTAAYICICMYIYITVSHPLVIPEAAKVAQGSGCYVHLAKAATVGSGYRNRAIRDSMVGANFH